MTEDLQQDSSSRADDVSLYRLCRHNYAGTLHLTNFWWDDSDEEVMGTAAVSEATWLDGRGRARLEVDLGSRRVRLQVLSQDARDCLTALTTYRLIDRVGHMTFSRQIADEVAQEAAAMEAATRGIAVADAWLAVLELPELRSRWRAEMIARGLTDDGGVESSPHATMPLRLVAQSRRTWATAYDGAKQRHAALIVEWEDLKQAAL